MASQRRRASETGEVSLPKRSKTTEDSIQNGSHADHDQRPRSIGDYTIAWICALPLELAASRAMLDEKHPQLHITTSDSNAYVLGSIRQHDIVMTCLPGLYGNNNAAAVATNLRRSFPNIRATLMVGIGGGCPSQIDLYLGDVVVGSRIMQYDLGKVGPGGHFQGTGTPMVPDPVLNSAVSELRSRADPGVRLADLLQTRLPHLERPVCVDRLFQASYDHPSAALTCDGCDLEKLQARAARASIEPKVHYGVIVSGNRVIKDGKTRDEIAKLHSAYCFEMEAAGIMCSLPCLAIRGICDYADSHKNKVWQDYAAATAAAYARDLLQGMRPSHTDYSFAVQHNHELPSARSEELYEQQKRLLESLPFPQIDARRANIGNAYSKTCSWLLRLPEYVSWLDPQQQQRHHGFFWMRGKAGAGKSTMMKFLLKKAKQTHRDPTMAVASFFFNARGEYLEKSVTGMYRSILLQLLESFTDLQSVFDDADLLPRSQEDCPGLHALKELLQTAVMGLRQRRFTCFIDALDECDEQEVRDMIQYFEDLTEQTTDNGIHLRVCFSSRPYPYIEIRRGALITLEDQDGHLKDLESYVDKHLRVKADSLRAEIQTMILTKAGGIFMWVVLVVDILNKENATGGLAMRKRVLEIPAKLGELFRSILKRDQDRPKEMLLSVLWVLCAKRPLSPAEFQHALWAGLLEHDLVDPEIPCHEENALATLITGSSKGLAEITKSKDPKVQFIHQSVPDFLVKEKGLQDIWSEVGFDWEGSSHERLRRCCDKYLSLPVIQKFIDRHKQQDEKHTNSGIYPFLRYASQNILEHSNIAQTVIPQDDFLSQFFSSDMITVINLFESRKIRRYSTEATPLYILADKGLQNLVDIQMKKETLVRTPREPFQHPFFAALANGHTTTVAALLNMAPTSSSIVSLRESLKSRKDLRGYKGRTPLSWAIQEGRVRIVKALLEKGADPNEKDTKGNIPIVQAASQGGHSEIVQMLLANGADANAQSGHYGNALQAASRGGHSEIVQMLLANEADANAQGGYYGNALQAASRGGHSEIVQMLLANEADANAQGGYYGNALQAASQGGHSEIVQMLRRALKDC